MTDRRGLRARLGRLPLRTRLVAGFTVAMLVVLVAAGAFIYWRVDYALDRSLDTELIQAGRTLEPLVGPQGRMTDRVAAEATGAGWQVLDADGAVVDYGGPASGTSLISESQLDRTRNGPRVINVGDFLPSSAQPYRVRIIPLPASGRFLVVGVRRDHRDEALRELLAQLAVAGLGALVVTAFVGDRLARAALRPVEQYRRRAADIARGGTERRLDVPVQRDDEITRLGHTFNDLLSTLDGSLERERQFVNEASHELRTPIALLSGRVQLALRRARSQAEHEHILAELQIDLERLARLADQLLQLGPRPVDGSARCDLAAVVERVVEHRRLAAPVRAAALSVELPAEPVSVALADFEVERIVANLLDNAATHGAPPLAVVVDLVDGGWARLVVTDDGPGMTPELLATGTHRFTRAPEARPRPGGGLGLSLVEAMVARADGELRLCYDGRHQTHGRAAPVACTHGPAMTVTVLLPGQSE